MQVATVSPQQAALDPVPELARTTTMMTMPSRSSSSTSMTEPSLLQRHHELQLQGPRPAPLKVSTASTDDMVVKKRRMHHQNQRQPVIIYVESPRVVHAHPAEFKSVVQRLTGAPPPAPAPSPPNNTMVFSASAPAPPLQLQFPFQFPLVGAAAGSAMLPLTSSFMSSVTVADANGPSSFVGQQNLCSDPFLPPLPSSSLASFYHQHHHGHGGDLFIAHHQ